MLPEDQHRFDQERRLQEQREQQLREAQERDLQRRRQIQQELEDEERDILARSTPAANLRMPNNTPVGERPGLLGEILLRPFQSRKGHRPASAAVAASASARPVDPDLEIGTSTAAAAATSAKGSKRKDTADSKGSGSGTGTGGGVGLGSWLLLLAVAGGAAWFFLARSGDDKPAQVALPMAVVPLPAESLAPEYQNDLVPLPAVVAEPAAGPVAVEQVPDLDPWSLGQQITAADWQPVEVVAESSAPIIEPEAQAQSLSQARAVPVTLEADVLKQEIAALQLQLQAVQQRLRSQVEWNATLEQGLQQSGLLKPGQAMAAGRFVRPVYSAPARASQQPAATAPVQRVPTPNATPGQVAPPVTGAHRLPSAMVQHSPPPSRPALRVAPNQPEVLLLGVDMWQGRPSVVVATTDPSLGRRVLTIGDESNGVVLRDADPRTQQATFLVGGKPMTLHKAQ